MNDEKVFDLSEYLEDNTICLEDLKIQNCRIDGLCSAWAKKELVITNCIFEHVTFDNHCGRGYVRMEGSEFTDCTFHDTLGSGKLEVEKCTFTKCAFENMSISGVGISILWKCHFTECDFCNVDLKWHFAIYGLEMNGGKIENTSIVTCSITEIKMSHMRLEHVRLCGGLKQNRMESVVFQDVFLEGSMGEEGSGKENQFINCDMDGFSFQEGGELGFESLAI